jgi:hypothetical protein
LENPGILERILEIGENPGKSWIQDSENPGKSWIQDSENPGNPGSRILRILEILETKINTGLPFD